MAQTKVIMVVGAGQMGRTIAQIAAQSGYTVLIQDLEPAYLEQCYPAIELELSRQSELSNEEKQVILERIEPTNNLQDSVQADFIIEAATENLTIKQQIFSALSNYTTTNTILATNTSSLSVTQIASATDIPENVIGMHFMYPVPSLAMVEVVRGLKTSDRTCTTTIQLAHSLGKEAIEVNDSPGFVSNRLLMPMINEAILCVFDGVAKAESVDRIMQLGIDYPLGPLQLADMIGLDICLSILDALYRGLGDPKYRPCPLLRNMVKAGKIGRKSGEGFYRYDN